MKEIDKNWVYRYRSLSPLTLKELMYEELYFSYPEELNDPLDLGAEIMVSAGADYVYNHFICSALEAATRPRKDKLADDEIEFSRKISKKTSETQNNIKIFFTEEYESWFKNEYNQANLDPYKYERFYKYLTNTISNLYPNNLLSVSFSGEPDNPLLWSIYGDSHRGFALIFSPDNKGLRLRKFMDDEHVERKLNPVSYDNDIYVDLSLMFNESNEFDWNKLYEEYFPALSKKALLTKNSNWHKESELRICLGVNIGFSHLESKVEKLTIAEKVYHYNQDQLVGIIFGCNMKHKDREKVRKIFELKKVVSKIFRTFD